MQSNEKVYQYVVKGKSADGADIVVKQCARDRYEAADLAFEVNQYLVTITSVAKR